LRIKTVFKFSAFICIFAVLSACSEKNFSFSNGASSALSDYQGQWLLINYWAVWCKPCVEEIPELNRINEQENITVLGYNFDKQSGESLAKQVMKLSIKFSNLSQDPAILFDQVKPSVLPATMVINPEGMFQEWLLGPQTQESIQQVLLK